MAKNPKWTVEEIVLATELLVNNEFRVVGPKHPDVVALSKVLNQVPIHSLDTRNDDFRSPSSIDRKLANIRSMNPGWTGGSTNVSKLDDYFWRVLHGNFDVLKWEAASIRAKYGVGGIEGELLSTTETQRFTTMPEPKKRSLDDLTIQQIHRNRLKWFDENEGAIVSFSQINAVRDPLLISRPTGIYRPSGWDYALSVRETLASPYGDVPIRTLPNGDWVYRYHREDGRNRPTNDGLLACLRDQIPVGVLIQVQVKPNVQYLVAGLGLVRGFRAPWFDIVSWRRDETALVSDDGRTTKKRRIGQGEAEAAPTRFIEVAAKEAYSRQLIRPNQPLFRFMLLRSYEKRCAITESRVIPVLEAAHIRPYSYDRIDSVQNGLLLRADIHRLFDRGLLGVNTSRMETVISAKLMGSEYEQFEGQPLILPSSQDYQPSVEYLDDHRKQWQLT